MIDRAYICHTYYQVYIAILKELYFKSYENKKSILFLSEVSTNFFDLKDKIIKTNIFSDVIMLNEPHPSKISPFLYKKIGCSLIIFRLIYRILYSHKIANTIKKNINYDFKCINEIFLCNDPDPIGYYFWKEKIKFILVEDSFNLYKRDVIEGDRRFWKLKYLLFKLNLIYIPNGYANNVISIEVNENKDIVGIPKQKIYEMPRNNLINRLSLKEKQQLINIFEGEKIFKSNRKTLLLVTQCLYPINVPTLSIEKDIYCDIIKKYEKEFEIYIKPHPRDKLEYDDFKNCVILGKYYPIEILNYISDIEFDLCLTIFSTSIDTIEVCKEKIYLGKEYINAYLK